MTSQPMTSRERVRLALDHRQPDRVPFDVTFTEPVYRSLRAALGLPPEEDKPIGIWSDVSPSLDLIEAMHIDLLYLGLNPASAPSPLAQQDGLRYDQWGVGRKKVARPDGHYYYEMVKHPLANATLAEVEAYPWPDPYDAARVEGVRTRFLKLRQETDKAIVAKFTTSIWEQSSYLFGLQSWLETLALRPEVACVVLDRTCDVALGLAEVGLRAAGDLIDIFRLSGEDLGTQRNSLISPRMYETYVRPRHARLWSFIKNYLAEIDSQAKIMLHSCGSVHAFIPSWIEMGLDILDPVQPTAVGMQPQRLKADFGERLSFHGGLDLQEVLPYGTPEQVRLHVRDTLSALAPGGGFILSPAHNVQSDVSAQNLIAVRDALLEFDSYPGGG